MLTFDSIALTASPWGFVDENSGVKAFLLNLTLFKVKFEFFTDIAPPEIPVSSPIFLQLLIVNLLIEYCLDD